jgi:hypothetical protein
MPFMLAHTQGVTMSAEGQEKLVVNMYARTLTYNLTHAHAQSHKDAQMHTYTHDF